MQNIQSVTFNVAGMTCGSCVRHINAAVRELRGVIDVEVKLKEGKVMVDYEPSLAEPSQLSVAIQGAGYEVEGLAA